MGAGESNRKSTRKKQIKSKSTDMVEKTSEIVKEYPKKIIKEISKIEEIAKKSIIYNRR